ncbi:MAG TPA: DUF1302 domain-containing protein [Candidatus Binatia bacterium]|nr:DUF1302 domain-containing protein [Candidatus Binatia bacterium]
MRIRSAAALLPVLLGSYAAGAQALEASWRGFSVKLDNSYSAGAAMRTSDVDLNLVGLGNGGHSYSTNGDDGDLAYRKGDVVSGAARLASDLTVSYKDFGAFVSGSGTYSPVADRKSFFDERDFGPGRALPLGELDAKTAAVRHELGSASEMREGYVFGGGTFMGRQLSFRVGRQMLDWGNASLIRNGLASVQALDLNRVHLPDVNPEEILRPAGMIWSAAEITERLSLEGFYQYAWRATETEAAGSYWSVNDFVGAGGDAINLGFGRVGENTLPGSVSQPGVPGVACLPVAPATPAQDCVPLGSVLPRAGDRTPRDGGQFGGGVHFTLPILNEMDVSLQAARYHSRLPLVSMISAVQSSLPAPSPSPSPLPLPLPAELPSLASPGQYFVEYPEAIKMYGAAFNGAVPGWLDLAVHGEYSFKNGQPLQIDDVELVLASLGLPSQLNPVPGATLGQQVLQGWRRYNVSQADFNFTRVFGPRFRVDAFTLFGEAGWTHVHNLPDAGTLRLEGPGTDLPGSLLSTLGQNVPLQREGYPTADSWGYRLAGRMTFNKVLKRFTVEPTLRFHHDVQGITPAPIGNFVQGRKQGIFSVGFGYKSVTAELGYTNYLGGGVRNLLSDRDYLALNLKYGF